MTSVRDTRRETRDAKQFRRVPAPVSRVSLALLILTSVISGCATPHKQTVASTRDAASLHEWQARGRIAVSGATDGGSGSFTWSQHGSTANVQIRGPIGIGNLHLTIDDSSLKIDAGSGHHYVDQEAEEDLTERLGAPVPASDLRFWLVGIAAPGDHIWEPSATPDSATLIQHAWRIDFQRFDGSSGVRLPAKFVAVSGPAKVRVVIDRWNVK